MTFTKWPQDYRPDERTALEKIPAWRFALYCALAYIAACVLAAL